VSGVHVLDYGVAAYDSSDDTFGTLLINSGTYVTNATILAATERWADGWYNCSNSTAILSLAMGSNDSENMGTGSDGYPLPSTHALPLGGTGSGLTAAGEYFGRDVKDLNDYISGAGYGSQMSGAGDIDAEPAFDPDISSTDNRTITYLTGYNADTGRPNYDSGSGEPGYWTMAHFYTIAQGLADDAPFPEIYVTGTPNGQIVDWVGSSDQEGLDQYAHSENEPFSILGVTAEWTATGDCASYLTPDDAWTDTLNATNTVSGVYAQSNITYLTNICD
jgi:hypothetical protein